MRLAGSKTDNNVPTIAPTPTPTINNRKAYNMVLAMGFNLVLRDPLLSIFGLSMRTVFNLTFPVGENWVFRFNVGTGFTPGGIIIRDAGLRPPDGMTAGLIGLFRRANAAASLALETGC
jgi:hypothetical protein